VETHDMTLRRLVLRTPAKHEFRMRLAADRPAPNSPAKLQ
jgi:hypothetical protein